MRPADSVTVCGIHAVAALLQEKRIKRLYVSTSGGKRRQQLLEAADNAGIPVIRESPQQLSRRAAEKQHQGMVAEAALPAGSLSALLAAPLPLVVLDGVTDPRNLGAVMRVVRAFGGSGVIAAARRSAPLSPAAQRAAAGAAAHLPVVRVANIARTLRQIAETNRVIFGAAEDGGENLFSTPLPTAPCWVLGDEGGGLRRLTREHCHHLVRIPTVTGDAGCLNVATACAICMAATTCHTQ